MRIETERLIIRDFNANDLNDLHEIFSHEMFFKNPEKPYSIQQTKGFLMDFCINTEPRPAFAVASKKDNKLAGYILFNPVGDEGVREMGWFFSKKYWTLGYALESCKEIIAHGFEQMEVKKIIAETADTERAIPLIEKLGMTQEGKQKIQHKETGEWQDLYWFGYLADNYFKDKNARLNATFHSSRSRRGS